MIILFIIINSAASQYQFWKIPLIVFFTASCVYPDILCIIRCLQLESAVM